MAKRHPLESQHRSSFTLIAGTLHWKGNLSWTAQGDGTEHDEFHLEDMDWNAADETIAPDGTVTLVHSYDNSGDDSYTTNDGPADLAWIIGSLAGSTNLTLPNGSNILWSTFNTSAKTKVVLHTGGKGQTGRQGLFQLTPTATDDSTGLGIPPQQISVAGKTLGADGVAWLEFQDGITVDVTPQASAPLYDYGISAQKYTPVITANTVSLDPDTVVSGAQFCVGQYIAFGVNGLPSYVNSVQHWSLPGTFVNEQFAYSTSCTSYRENTGLLANLSTACWYVDQLNVGTASIGMNLHFSNGQFVSIAADGKFSVFKPQILGHTQVSSGTVELNTNDLSNIRLGMLYAGSDYIHWTAEVEMEPNFPGTLSYVQLTDFEASYDIGLYCVSKGDTTGGQYWLDNTANASDIHDPNQSIFSAIQGIPFGDGPEIDGSFCTFAQLTPSFKTYLRFQPDGGIPITLERTEWTEYGRTDLSGGTWSLTTHNVVGPQFYNDDSFPVWLQVFTNN